MLLRRTHGFTLIELLVVITIIVILLALLTPALDRAIYQAELAVCGSRQRAVASGATIYASTSRRQYPYRKFAQSTQARPVDIRSMEAPGLGPSTGLDDRPVLRTFMALNAALNDPLSPGDLDFEGSGPTTNVISSYALYFGWGYRGEQGMNKLGDRLTYLGDRFDLLAGDVSWSFVDSGDNNHLASHEDGTGLMEPWYYQDRLYVSWNYTMTHWTTAGKGARGPIDLNYAFTDGSVVRFNKLEWYEGAGDAKDPTRGERFLWTPQWNIPSNQITGLAQAPRR